MDAAAGRRAGERIWPFAGDAAPPLVLFAATLAQPPLLPDPTYGELSAAGAGIGALVCLVLLWRRRWPVPVLAATVAGVLAYVAVTGLLSPFWIGVVVATYTVAAWDRWAVALAAVPAAALVLAGGALLLTGGEWNTPHYFGLVLHPVFGSVLGYAVRGWRAHLSAGRDGTPRGGPDRVRTRPFPSEQ